MWREGAGGGELDLVGNVTHNRAQGKMDLVGDVKHNTAQATGVWETVLVRG